MLAQMFAILLTANEPAVEQPNQVPLCAKEICRKGEATKSRILRLQPRLNAKQAWHVGWLIEHYAEKYQLDPLIMTAIIRQESNFQSGIKVCKNANGTCDIGLAQINELWVTTWDLDVDKLQNDDSYNVAIMARILKMLYNQYQNEDRWWGRYNSARPAPRAIYEGVIGKHLLVLASAT